MFPSPFRRSQWSAMLEDRSPLHWFPVEIATTEITAHPCGPRTMVHAYIQRFHNPHRGSHARSQAFSIEHRDCIILSRVLLKNETIAVLYIYSHSKFEVCVDVSRPRAPVSHLPQGAMCQSTDYLKCHPFAGVSVRIRGFNSSLNGDLLETIKRKWKFWWPIDLR